MEFPSPRMFGSTFMKAGINIVERGEVTKERQAFGAEFMLVGESAKKSVNLTCITQAARKRRSCSSDLQKTLVLSYS